MYLFTFLPLYAPFMSGYVIYGAGDTLGFDYPPLLALQPFSIDSLLSDPLSGQGFPWLVTYGTLDPIAHILRIFFDAYQTLGWLIYIYLVFGSLFFALFLQRHHFSKIASFIGGLVFTCAFFWTADGDYPLAFSIPLFSSLLFILSFARTNVLWSSFFSILMIGYGWLAGHFNYTPLILVGCGVYACYDIWTYRSKGWNSTKPVFVLGIGIIGGTCIGLLKLIPALAYVQLSERAGGLSVSVASTMTLPLSALYTAFFPYLRLPLMPGDTGVLFYGAMALALALIGAFSRDKRVRPLLMAWAAIFLITLPHSPLYAVIQHLPFFSFLRTPYRWMFLAHACVATLVAMGTDAWIQQDRTHISKRIGIVFLIIAVLSLIISLTLLILDVTLHQAIVDHMIAFFDAHLLSKTSGLSIEHYHHYIENTWMNLVTQCSLLSPRFLLPFLGLLFTAIFFLKQKFLSHAHRLVVLCVLLAFTSVSPLFFYHPRALRSDVEHVRALYDQSGLKDQRVMPIMPAFSDFTIRSTEFGEQEGERVPYQLGLLVPNMQTLLGVESIDFYQPLQSSRMGRLLAALGSDNAPAPQAERLALQAISPDEKIAIIAKRAPLLAKLGVHAVVSAWDLPSPFVKAGSIKPVKRLPAISLYRVPSAQALIGVLVNITIQKPDEQKALSFLTHLHDVTQDLLECTSCSLQGQDALHTKISVLRDEPTRVVVAVEEKQDTLITIRRARLPGYRVLIDGEPVHTAIANGIYPGILVSKGKHEVEMKITYAWLLEDSLKFLLTKKDPWLL